MGGLVLDFAYEVMPRKTIPISPIHPYSISARCINKEWFTIPLEDVWSIMEDYLAFLHFGFNFKIKSFVLMSNHFHLLAMAPDGNLSEGMNYFMRETSRAIGKQANRINQVYGGRFYRSLIRHEHHFRHVYKYIYRNPVEAKMVSSPFDYRYSTLPGLIGKSKLHIPIDYDFVLFESFEETVEWLNRKPNPEHEMVIKSALSNPEFTITRNRRTNKVHELEFELY